MTTTNRFKLRSVNNHGSDLWGWCVLWANGKGLVWECTTNQEGKGISIVRTRRIVNDSFLTVDIDPPQIISHHDNFTLAGCAKPKVYQRIHKIFDRMRIPK